MNNLRNFYQVGMGINTMPVNLAIARQPELWNAYGVRRWHEQATPQQVVDDIILRYNKFDPRVDEMLEAVVANLSVECYPPWQRLPEAVEIVNLMMQAVRGVELGRVFVARLGAGKGIPPHSDRIGPAEEAFPMRVPSAVYYDRYHVVLRASPGVQFRCGDEVVEMKTGEFWWFNNQLEHEVINNSADDRLHLIVDIHSPQGVYVPPVAVPQQTGGMN